MNCMLSFMPITSSIYKKEIKKNKTMERKSYIHLFQECFFFPDDKINEYLISLKYYFKLNNGIQICSIFCVTVLGIPKPFRKK